MAIAPNSTIKLLSSVPLPADRSSTFFWPSASAQRQYFEDFAVKTIENATYIRKDNSEYLAVPYSKDEIITVNYVMYKNSAYENKWFYGFVSEIRYVNDNVSHVIIDEDSIQSWYFEMHMHQTFIERQHQTTDSIGVNLVDEPVSPGTEFDVIYTTKIPFGNPSEQARLIEYDLVFVCSDLPNPSGELEEILFYSYVSDGLISILNKGFNSGTDYVYNGLYFVKLHHWDTWPSNYTSLVERSQEGFATVANNIILAYIKGNRVDAILSAYMMPDLYRVSSTKSGSWTYSSVNAEGDYVPFNNKLYTYPYNYGQVWTMTGNSRDFAFEDFDDGHLHLSTFCDESPQPLPIAVPSSYKGQDYDYSLGIYLSPMPQIAWTTDQYLAWIANYGALQTAVGAAEGAVIGGAENLVKGNIVGAAGALLSPVTGMINAGLNTMRLQSAPQLARGNQSADFSNYKGLNVFNFKHIRLRSDYCRIVDDYFTMYGYAQKKLAYPNIHARSRYTYIKTIGDPVYGNIPGNSLAAINTCFNNGITFWNDQENFLDYNMKLHPNLPL